MEAHGFGPHGFWFLFMVFFWVALLPKVRHAFWRRPRRQAATPGTPTVLETPAMLETPGEDAALRILRERFARGEIDRAEYEERREALLRWFPADAPTWPE